MARQRPLLPSAVLLLAMLFACSGATCNRQFTNPFAQAGPPAPQVLQPTATAQDIVSAVNANTEKVRSYSVSNATITVPGMANLPLLSGNVAVERPRRLRLQASTAITGPEVDVGSNDQQFWIWSRRNEPPALYFARHDQYATSSARTMMPIEPAWLIDALGLVTLDPTAAYEGPFRRNDGTLEISCPGVGPNGPIKRTTVVDPARAWVVEQHVYDANGQILASAYGERFRFDPVSQVSLPERVTMKMPATNLSLTLDMQQIAVNSGTGDPTQLWAMPTLQGYPQVDLATLGQPPAPVATPGGGTLSYPPQVQNTIPAAPISTSLPQSPAVGGWKPADAQPPAYVGQLPANGISLTQ